MDKADVRTGDDPSQLVAGAVHVIEADKKQRVPQKAPKKQAISIRLSADVLQALRAPPRLAGAGG